MATTIPLTEEALPDNCYLFKHSTACPVSAAAADEVRAMLTDLDIYWVDVIERRPLSNWVAAEYGVPHASPQLLLIRNGEVKRAWSHSAITRDVAQES